ncbi:MAG: hypothetical protein ACOYEB_07175 [Enterococcus lemanii]|jgi:hypothetical protein
MTTKDWLMRAWRIDKEIEAMLVARKRAYDRCTSVTTRPREVVVSSSHDPDTAMIALLNIEALIDERIDQLNQIKAEILNAITAVQDCTLRTLLIERYINFKTWEQIAVDMGYSFAHVTKTLHPMALQKLDYPKQSYI